MGGKNPDKPPVQVWSLALKQHGVITRSQLLERGYSRHAIAHRLDIGRLHRIHAGVYAMGTPEITREGRWMGAVLACGSDAVLSHGSAAALYGLLNDRGPTISVSVPHPREVRRPGIRVHRARLGPGDAGTFNSIPVTSPARTLIDLATEVSGVRLERAVNEADKLRLIDPESLREELGQRPSVRGGPALRKLLHRDTFALTDSELERRFLRIALLAGLALPETGVRINGFVVDFFWRDLGLVVETDGLRYHRTPSQQARDRRRDQAHAGAGLTTLRFTHSQIFDEADAVARTLEVVAGQLAGRRAAGSRR
jgi:very-short-patch-repair endonuclease